VPLVKADQVQQVLIEKITKQVEQSEIPAIVGKQQQQIEDLKKKRTPAWRTDRHN
jgi:hypothetical protein